MSDINGNKIIELTKQKLSSREIARKLSISKNTILRKRKDEGIEVILVPGINKIVEVKQNGTKF